MPISTSYEKPPDLPHMQEVTGSSPVTPTIPHPIENQWVTTFKQPNSHCPEKVGGTFGGTFCVTAAVKVPYFAALSVPL